jgi:LuxR family maltose regulon positive regulatory protein
VTTALIHTTARIANDLLLKVTPPRVPRHRVARPRLQIDDEDLRERAVILVQAPAGFGKTSLLAQWRLEHLARGRVVAWLSAQPHDDTGRFVQGLALAVRTGAGRSTFGHTLLVGAVPAGLEGVTLWLAELAQSAMDIVLFIDEVDRLPEPTREALVYLMRNAPPNLRTVLAARADCRLEIDDLIAYGSCTVVGSTQLRFQLDETMELVRTRFGTGVDRDAVARLHELTEGWPLGLQLALSVMAAGSDPQVEISMMEAQGGALRDQFVNLLLANLDPADLAFVTRIAILDPLHPDLCRFVAKDETAPERLERLARDTPVFVAVEASDWLRMHALARGELQRRFALLPAEEQAQLHARAVEALAAMGLLEAAAGHALAAGQREVAYDLAERSLYESLMSRGRQGAVLDWLARMPVDEVNSRPRLLLAAAWSLAVSERHEKASHFIERILAQPGANAAVRCECALIQSGAAVYADDPDRFAELHDPWAQDPPLTDSLLLQVHANRSAFRTLLEGEPSLARLRQQQAPHGPHGEAMGYPTRWADFIIGLSYLWEGQVLLVEKLLRPTLARTEIDLGRPQSVHLHAGVLAGRCVVGTQSTRRGRCAAGQPARRARACRTARKRAAGLSHDGADRERGGCRTPCPGIAGRARCGRRGAPAAAPVRCEPRRPGALERTSLPRRDLPGSRGPDRRAARRAGCTAGTAVARQRDAVARPGDRLRGRRGPGLAPCGRRAGARRPRRASRQDGPSAHRDAGPSCLGTRPLRRKVARPVA